MTSMIKVDEIQNSAGTTTLAKIENGQLTGVLSPATGFKNRVINGDMRIDQRNNGAAVTIVNGTNQYTVDRWQVLESSSCVLSAQQVTDAPSSFQNSLKITVTTAAGSVGASEIGFFEQRLEGFNTADFAFGTASASDVTLSFFVKSSITGNFSGSLRNGGSNRSYPFNYTINTANTWEQKTVTVDGDTAGTWAITNGIGIRLAFDLGSGSNRRGTADAWAASANFDGVTGAASIVTTLNATWQVTGVQLEKGTVATPFEFRSIGQELGLCQRYYFRTKPDNDRTFGSSFGRDTTRIIAFIHFPVPMRAFPTALEQTGTATDYRQISQATGGGDSTCSSVPTLSSTSPLIAFVNFFFTSGIVLGSSGAVVTGSADAFLGFTAEL